MIQESDRVDVSVGSGSTAAPFNVGDWVRATCGGKTVDGEVREVLPVGGWWLVRLVRTDGVRFDMDDQSCVLVKRCDALPRETPTDPLARFASLIADAERAVDGPATEQANAIASLAKALRESQASCEEARRTLRSIVELAR